MYLFARDRFWSERRARVEKIEATTRASAPLTRVVIAHFFLSLSFIQKYTAVSSPRAVNSTDLHNPGAT